MEQTERVYLHESCVVPYRRTDQGIEFCLVSPFSGNRWDFPKASTDGDAPGRLELLGEAAATVGLRGQLHDDGPLDAFASARGNEARRVTAYLMHVTLVDDNWPGQSTHRRLWCLAEEARARLRRKPLRRFIDIALRSVGPTGSAADGSRSSLPRRPR